jgi:molybdenum cofactor cytidylyltransferase
MNDTAIIILAAGASARLGRTKQLLPYRNKTLLTGIIAAAFAAGLQPVVLVTGADEKNVLHSIADKSVKAVFNADWPAGMGGSIAVGIREVLASVPHPGKVILAVCDQPDADETVFRRLIDRQHETGKGIIASAYSGTVGTPCLFTEPYYQHLAALSGVGGAKGLLRDHGADLATISFEQGARDIDTAADYEALLNSIKQ